MERLQADGMTKREHAIEDYRSLPLDGDVRVPRICDLFMAGESWKAIAITLGVTEKTLWNIRQRYGLDEYLDALLMQQHERHLRAVSAMADKAHEIIRGALHGKADQDSEIVPAEIGPAQLDAAKYVSTATRTIAQQALKLRAERPPRGAAANPAALMDTEEIEALLADGSDDDGSDEAPAT